MFPSVWNCFLVRHGPFLYFLSRYVQPLTLRSLKNWGEDQHQANLFYCAPCSRVYLWLKEKKYFSQCTFCLGNAIDKSMSPMVHTGNKYCRERKTLILKIFTKFCAVFSSNQIALLFPVFSEEDRVNIGELERGAKTLLNSKSNDWWRLFWKKKFPGKLSWKVFCLFKFLFNFPQTFEKWI